MTIKHLAGNRIQGLSTERPADPNYPTGVIFDESDTGKSYVLETYNVRTFTASGTFTITDGAGYVEYLVIGGGGGGGTLYSASGNSGGGGGAGAYREG